ncbi:MAG: PilZ domain-containing protein, partial [Candidatus Omnitrophica bacterium]|nr:PilZ domain-containing protein [Candidatus Omnitrophota bacterium]
LYRVEDSKELHECRSKDINYTGVCIFTDENLPKNKKITLTMDLGDNTKVEVEGDIVWSKNCGQGHMVGINLHNVSQRIQKLMLEHAFEVKK